MSTEPRVEVTSYTVCCLPPDHIDEYHFRITVERRAPNQWAVMHNGYCLHTSGRWDYEPLPSSRTDQWKKSHRFDLETALKKARRMAPDVTVNGWTVEQVIAKAAARDELRDRDETREGQ